MKKIILFIILAFCTSAVFPQNASTYFPSSPGYKWFYKNTPLDSLNNPQTNLATFQVDSFAQNTTYNGLPASQILSKSGLLSINQNTPYTDTNYLNFQSTNGYPYLNVLGLIGSLPGLDSVAFVEFLRSFNGWYNTYRFAQTVNTNYTIFSRDTTLNIDTLSLPLRISSTGRRLTDQTISTVNGSYLCKKFLLTFKIELAILPPILYIPIVTLPDTAYIASDIWIVKESSPSVNVDLSGLGFPIDFTIPGSLKELTSGSVGISTLNNSIADKFELSQNYPNPFNPTTNLEFGISELGFISLKVYNAAGKEVQTLVNEKLPAGKYSVTFDGSNLSSGIYYYKFESGGFVETKSMILLK
ncbi:MAG TPA: T9SS type A sorting domain-containing protein [Ignavibacteria bacterium]|nr:T9SS type A sorting domain-containing protein [Ignavibacteria bacterium]HMR41441.1 T9SS type A sorting domain-containing protein [Ignavibacteria bacterium]